MPEGKLEEPKEDTPPKDEPPKEELLAEEAIVEQPPAEDAVVEEPLAEEPKEEEIKIQVPKDLPETTDFNAFMNDELRQCILELLPYDKEGVTEFTGKTSEVLEIIKLEQEKTL